MHDFFEFEKFCTKDIQNISKKQAEEIMTPLKDIKDVLSMDEVKLMASRIKDVYMSNLNIQVEKYLNEVINKE